MFSCNEVHETSEKSQGVHTGHKQNYGGLFSVTAIVGHTRSIGLILANAIVSIAYGEFAIVVTGWNGDDLMEMQVGQKLLCLYTWRLGGSHRL